MVTGSPCGGPLSPEVQTVAKTERGASERAAGRWREEEEERSQGVPSPDPLPFSFLPRRPPPGGARLPLGTFAVVGLGLVPSPPAGPAGASVGARSHGGCLWSLDTALPPEVGPGWDTPAVPGQSGCGCGSAAGTRWGASPGLRSSSACSL